MPRSLQVTACVLVFLCGTAGAQVPDTLPAIPRPALKPGEPLKVFIPRGEFEAPFDSWRGDSLTVVMPGGRQAFHLGDISRIDARRRQPLLALAVGGLVGGGGSALSIWLSNSLNDLNDCGVQCPRQGNQTRTIMVNALIGAGLAFAYDTFSPGFKTIFRRRPPPVAP